MKITTTSHCPHCQMMTETLRLESVKCAIYICTQCWHEPSEKIELTIPKGVVINELFELIKILNKNTS